MGLKVSAGAGTPDLGGAGASLDVVDIMALGGNLQPGVNTGWVAGGYDRYGGAVVTIPGLNVFDNGSAGATPNRGLVVSNGLMWRRGRNTAAGNAPIDWYCGVRPNFQVTIPPVRISNPVQHWEVGATIMLDAIPAAPITRDCGLVFIMSANTTYSNVLRAGVAAGNDYAGFGVVFNGTNGELLWICKKNGAGGGAPLTESVSLGVYGINRPVPVRVRFHGAEPGIEAYLEVFLDNVSVLRRLWGAGTVLPVAADATFQAVLGYYSPMIRCGQDFAAGAVGLMFRDFRVRAAATDALLGTP